MDKTKAGPLSVIVTLFLAAPSMLHAEEPCSPLGNWSSRSATGLFPQDLDKPSKGDGNGNGNGKNGNGKEEDNAPEHMKDNSILVEEAFNQEAGVVQHIFNWLNAWDRQAGERKRSFAF